MSALRDLYAASLIALLMGVCLYAMFATPGVTP